MTVVRGPSGDPANPLHQASFYLEEIKYGREPGRLTGATTEEISRDMEALLRDAEVTSMTGAELVETCDYYARSFVANFATAGLPLPQIVSKTIFLDGVAHGIALAKGLKGEPR